MNHFLHRKNDSRRPKVFFEEVRRNNFFQKNVSLIFSLTVTVLCLNMLSMIDKRIVKSGNFFAKRSSKFVGNFFKLAIFCGLVFSCKENALAMDKMKQNEVEKEEEEKNKDEFLKKQRKAEQKIKDFCESLKLNENFLENENELKNKTIENEPKNTGLLFGGIFPEEIDDLISSFSRKKCKIETVKKNIEFQEIVKFFHNSNAFDSRKKKIKFINKKDRENAFYFTRKKLKKKIHEKNCCISLNTLARENVLNSKSRVERCRKIIDFAKILFEDINSSSVNFSSEEMYYSPRLYDGDKLSKSQSEFLITLICDQFLEPQEEFLFALFFDKKTECSQYEQLMSLPLSVLSEKDFPKVEKLLNFFQKKLNSVKKNENILENDNSLSFDFGINLDFRFDIKFLQENEFVKKYKKNISCLVLDNSICDEDLKTFSEINFANLKMLGLCCCQKITDAGLVHLKNLVNLQTLNLGGDSSCDIQITDAGLAHLKDLKNLRKLSLEYCREITDAGLVYLKDLKNLRKLNLHNCGKITDDGLKHLNGLVNLQTLNLEGCEEITDAGLVYLKDLNNLRKLNLHNCGKITDDGLKHLNGLVNLQTLNLNHCGKITNDGLAHLKGLMNLQTLYLTCLYKITSAGLAHLKGLINLQVLSLSNCHSIIDDGLVHLKGLVNLYSLNLESLEQITDTGLENLKELKNLRKLSLSCCLKITDAGLAHLKGLANLQWVFLVCCSEVTKEGVEMLKKAFPKLIIEY